MEGRPNTLLINVNYDVAVKYGWMPDVLLLEMEDDKAKRPALYRHKWLGEPNSLEGRIYNDWAVIEVVPHEARLVRRGLDFGYSNDPTAIVDIYEYNGGYILDEMCYRKGMTNKEISDLLKLFTPTIIIADAAEPKSIDEIAIYGHSILPADKGQGSVNQGIQYVQSKRISFTARSANLLKEYKTYTWLTDKNGKIMNEPMPTEDHLLDASRYGLTSLKPKNTETAQKQEQRFAINLTRQSMNSGK
jgi:phage terminase large subunit